MRDPVHKMLVTPLPPCPGIAPTRSGTRLYAVCFFGCSPVGTELGSSPGRTGSVVRLGAVEHLSLDQARDVARKVIAEYIQTGLPSIAKPELPKITLRAYLDDHYAPRVRTELKQADDALRRIEQAFADLLPMTLKDINAKVIERWWVTRLQDTIRPGAKQTISKATASRNLATLRSALFKAAKWGMLETNPVTNAALKVAKPFPAHSDSSVRLVRAILPLLLQRQLAPLSQVRNPSRQRELSAL